MGTVAVLDRPLDVVDVDVIAEDLRGVVVVRLDGRAGEADEGGVGQGVAHVFGEAIGQVGLVLALDQVGVEAVLAAVGLVGDEDDVVAARRAAGSRWPALRAGTSGWW